MTDVLDEYYAQARGWHEDRRARERSSARVAWWVAGAAGLLAALAVAAVLALTPLKRVEPYLVRVDASSGVVDVVPRYAGGVELPEAVTRLLLAEYVNARERYVAALAEADYERVGAQQGPQLNQAWAALWDRSNPASPLNVHRDGGSSDVQVQSVTFLSPGSGAKDLAQVRFRRTVRGGEPAQYLATLKFAYGKPADDDRQRLLNPLGFRVVEYRREPEVLALPRLAATPATEVGTGATP
jgi:type IV secretion system protein VirB8